MNDLIEYTAKIKENIKKFNPDKPHSPGYYEEQLKKLSTATDFIKLAQKLKGYKLIPSPYNNVISSSFYLVPEAESVKWGYKPEKSYRLSDHWNWIEYNEYTKETIVHCPTNTGNDFGVAIGVFENGKYKEVKDV